MPVIIAESSISRAAQDLRGVRLAQKPARQPIQIQMSWYTMGTMFSYSYSKTTMLVDKLRRFSKGISPYLLGSGFCCEIEKVDFDVYIIRYDFV